MLLGLDGVEIGLIIVFVTLFAAILRWNVETIGVSPNGFNAYFLFKVLILAYTGLIMIHALAFFYRSFLEWREGEDSEGKYLDMDIRTSEEAGK